jgi:predicted HTH transcriptional regulator
LPVGDPGIIFFGVRNDGRPEGFADAAIESHLKKLSGELSNIYPPIEPQLLARQTDNGLNFIAVIVNGSPNSPHFAGKSYIRDGTKTVEASEKHVEILIDRRGSKTNEILKSLNKTIRVDYIQDDMNTRVLGQRVKTRYPVVQYCNQFFVSLRYTDHPVETVSLPLHRVAISHDDQRGCLLLEVAAVQ